MDQGLVVATNSMSPEYPQSLFKFTMIRIPLTFFLFPLHQHYSSIISGLALAFEKTQNQRNKTEMAVAGALRVFATMGSSPLKPPFHHPRFYSFPPHVMCSFSCKIFTSCFTSVFASCV